MAKSSDLSPKALKRLHEIGHWARRAPCSCTLDRCVLREIADHADWKTGEAFPSVDTISAAVLAERKAVMRSVNRLVAQGLLIDTGRKAGQMNRQRIYQLPAGRDDTSRVPLIDTVEVPLNGTSEGPTLVRSPPPLNGTSEGPKPSKKEEGAYREGKTVQPAPPCSVSEKGGTGQGLVADVVDFVSAMNARHLVSIAPRTRKPRKKKKTTDRANASAATDVAPTLGPDWDQ